MQYAIIVGIIVIFAIITEIMLVKAFHYGVQVGKSKESAVPEPFPAVKRDNKKRKTLETSTEIKRMNDILNNIDVYDGTPIGQKEIKRG